MTLSDDLAADYTALQQAPTLAELEALRIRLPNHPLLFGWITL